MNTIKISTLLTCSLLSFTAHGQGITSAFSQDREVVCGEAKESIGIISKMSGEKLAMKAEKNGVTILMYVNPQKKTFTVFEVFKQHRSNGDSRDAACMVVESENVEFKLENLSDSAKL